MKKSIDFSTANNQEKYSLLSSAVAPRPIAFASTIDKNGKVNLSPFSFFNVFGANPPILVFSPVRSARTMGDKDTLINVREVPEVTISIVNFAMVEQVSLASSAYERGINEFSKSGFTEVVSESVKPPYVLESPVSFECIVKDIIETGSEGGAGHLVICEVLIAHVDTDYLKEDNVVDATKLDLVARMGENWYCRASVDSLFEVPKPIRQTGIGVDALPEHVRLSEILTGNNLGRLGNLERLPSDEEIMENRSEMEEVEEIHMAAQKLIDEGETKRALALLMTI